MSLGLAEDAYTGTVFLECLVKIIGQQRAVYGCLGLCRREDDGRGAGMLKMDGRDGQPHHGTEMQLKLGEIGGVAKGDHARVVRPWRQFAEDDFALTGQEELNTPDAGTREGFRHLVGHCLGLLQGLVADLIGLPRLAVVAAFLHMTDGRAEQRGPAVLLGNGKQGEL